MKKRQATDLRLVETYFGPSYMIIGPSMGVPGQRPLLPCFSIWPHTATAYKVEAAREFAYLQMLEDHSLLGEPDIKPEAPPH